MLINLHSTFSRARGSTVTKMSTTKLGKNTFPPIHRSRLNVRSSQIFFVISKYKLVFKYEEVLSNKAENIQRLANFLNVADPDITRIIEESSIEKSVANRKKAMEAAGKTWTEVDTACYRQAGM